jgi:transcriptional regulator with XRE-family HTH domain
MQADHFERVARQVLRALRAGRSQAAVSRRLGFRSNVAAKWESGQRMPTAKEVLGYGERLGQSPWQALCALNPNAATALGQRNAPEFPAWLRALKGTQTLNNVASRSGLSRFSVGRFLSGQSEPRLPQFLALLDAITDRLEDFIDAWLEIDNVPLLAPRLARSRAARDALFERPLCLAVLCLLDTKALDVPRLAQIASLGQALEQSRDTIDECLETLTRGGVIALHTDRYKLSGALTVEANAQPEREIAARSFWTKLAHERSKAPRKLDLCSYNVFSIARKDYVKLQQLQREFYRGARALVAASEPTELAGLLVVQLVSWEPQPESPTDQL